MVHFKLSNLIEVTRQWDVVVGDMVKFIIPSEAKAETRVTRDFFWVPVWPQIAQI
jgi:hypothetical protein